MAEQAQQNSTTGVIYVIDGNRTPFLRAEGKPGPFSPADLGVQALKSLLLRQTLPLTAIDSLITGSVIGLAQETNVSRVIGLRAGLPESLPAYTVNRNCGSGMQAVTNAWEAIHSGRADIVLAGGVDAMSYSPLLCSPALANWYGQWASAKSLGKKLRLLASLRPPMLRPELSLLQGLTDPTVNMSMGQTAEHIAQQFHITRQAMDNFAVQSHQRLAAAQHDLRLPEITPVIAADGTVYDKDTGLRMDTSLERLATLKPVFEKPFGLVTAGNSSQITDGAAFLLLASEAAVERYQLPVMAKLSACEWVGVNPANMGLGPVHAMAKLLKTQQRKLSDIQYIEINEAFAAQVLACVAALNDAEYCRDHLGLDEPVGLIDKHRLNVDGGAIALGHPVGASGVRIILHLIHALKQRQAKTGIASICVGGGQGGAILVEV